MNCYKCKFCMCMRNINDNGFTNACYFWNQFYGLDILPIDWNPRHICQNYKEE